MRMSDEPIPIRRDQRDDKRITGPCLPLLDGVMCVCYVSIVVCHPRIDYTELTHPSSIRQVMPRGNKLFPNLFNNFKNSWFLCAAVHLFFLDITYCFKTGFYFNLTTVSKLSINIRSVLCRIKEKRTGVAGEFM